MRKCVLIINLYTIRRKCHMIAESISRVVGGVWGRQYSSRPLWSHAHTYTYTKYKKKRAHICA